MKVAELIEILQQFPPELEVVGYDGRGDDRPISVYRCNNAEEVEECPHSGPLYDKIVVSTD